MTKNKLRSLFCVFVVTTACCSTGVAQQTLPNQNTSPLRSKSLPKVPSVVSLPTIATAPAIITTAENTVESVKPIGSGETDNSPLPLNVDGKVNAPPIVVQAPKIVQAPPIKQAPPIVQKDSTHDSETESVPPIVNGIVQAAPPIISTTRQSPPIVNADWNPQVANNNAPLDMRSATPIESTPAIQTNDSLIQLATSVQQQPSEDYPPVVSPVNAFPMNGQREMESRMANLPQGILPPVVSSPKFEDVAAPENGESGDLPPIVSKPIFQDPVPSQQIVPATESSISTSNDYVQPSVTQDIAPAPVMPQPRSVVEEMSPDDMPSNNFFEGNMVELGKGVSQYSGVSVVGEPLNGGCACGNCNTGGIGCESPRCQYDVDNVCAAFNCCGFIASAKNYYSFEGLYWSNETSGITGSNFFSSGTLDWTPGGRLTIGEKNGVRGRELIYTGVETWTTSTTRNLPTLLNANFVATTFPAIAVAPFFGADIQTQSLKARFQGLELNRTWWGWDVVKTTLGIRYIHYSEDYQLTSNDGGVIGRYFLETRNNLFGPQIGMELFYDVGRRFAFTFGGKVAGYANPHVTKVSARNGAISILNNRDESAEFSYSFELGASAHWKIGPRARLVTGYDLLGMYELNTASQNFNGVLSPASGTTSNANDDVFLHGISAGIEFYR